MTSLSQTVKLNHLHNLLLEFAPREQIKPGLERVQALCGVLNNPEKKFSAIHIAGTNGKGSTTTLIAHGLQAAGMKVGVYTSPHLYRWSERILVNQQEIELDEFIQTIEHLYETAKQVDATVFELVTAVAFQHFVRQDVDLAIIETGLGGRFDATNIVDSILTVITDISMDHANYLGNELSGIAWEKAGIIKQNIPVVTAHLNDISQQQINEECQLKAAPQQIANALEPIKFNWHEQVLDSENWGHIKLKMLGQWQAKNLALVLGVFDQLQKNYSLDKAKIIQGLESATWPGRFEPIQNSPRIVLDGAHNKQGAESLIETLNLYNQHFPITGKKWLLFGLRADKDHQSIIEGLFPWFDCILLTDIGGKFGLDPEVLVAYAQQTDLGTEVFEGATSALQYFKKHAKSNDLLCVSGSLYLVGEVRWQLLKDNR